MGFQSGETMDLEKGRMMDMELELLLDRLLVLERASVMA